ncbi:IS110 family transposase (plasmid) [Rhodobacter capsulatus]
MPEVAIVGIDIAKQVFQLHGAAADGSVAFRKKLSRGQLLGFLAELPPCIVAMEACATGHHWGREISALGHEVRLIPPIYVKPFVKRQKNDANDAEAISEAASRPTMRFVAVKSAEAQSQASLFRSRVLLVGQRTQLLNALRGHLAEYGLVAPAGAAKVEPLVRSLSTVGDALPIAIQLLARSFLAQIQTLSDAISELEGHLKSQAKCNTVTRRLQTMPGIGPMTAVAIDAFAPPPEVFRSGRDFAAWVGLVPRQHSTGGKARLGRVSKMGQQDIRRLLIIGAMAVVRWTVRKGPRPGSWLAGMLARKPKMLVAIALANKMARSLWAMLKSGENYRVPAAV